MLRSIHFHQILLCLFLFSCKDSGNVIAQENIKPKQETSILVGAEQSQLYLNDLASKKVGLVINQTSLVKGEHLVDYLLNESVLVKRLFSPEHGIRGKADAGEKVKSGKDAKTGLPIVSLYGKNRKPLPEQLEDIDLMVFDLQDVGVRFYTYISTLHYVMEACAEANIPLLLLDRPNPNAHYIDGPILDMKFKSFVGMHPVPIVYGMTIGEYAKMINGEKWLANGVTCDLKVISCAHYAHDKFYSLPIKPSPNLPNDLSVALYPSLCLFEGTTVSVGRGTNKQFQVYGHPQLDDLTFIFTPMPNEGSKTPKHKGKEVYGMDLSGNDLRALRSKGKLDLFHLLKAHRMVKATGEDFFNQNNFFEKLAGNDILRQQILEGKNEKQIRESWNEGLANFKKIRSNYLIYQ